MTNYELEKMSKRTAENLVVLLKTDSELLDLVFPPRLMGIDEAAEYTHIPKDTFYKACPQIPHMKVGKRLIFTDRELIRWMKRQ